MKIKKCLPNEAFTFITLLIRDNLLFTKCARAFVRVTFDGLQLPCQPGLRFFIPWMNNLLLSEAGAAVRNNFVETGRELEAFGDIRHSVGFLFDKTLSFFEVFLAHSKLRLFKFFSPQNTKQNKMKKRKARSRIKCAGRTFSRPKTF
jgi:hypothetical protein